MKKNLLKSVLSMVLCIAMVLTMLPITGVKVSAEIKTEDILSQVADPSTLDGYKDYFALNGALNTENAGGVWLDKSVLTDASALAGTGITKDDPNGFLAVLSTMAANMTVVGMSHVPTDSVLILDVSGSMDASRNNVAEDLVDAANESIATLLGANKYNRVSVVLYSGSSSSSTNSNAAITLLPLARYATGSDGEYLTYTNRYGESIGIDGNVVYEGTTNKPASQSKDVTGATYIQKGVLDALDQFLADSNSVTVNDPSAGLLRRKPVVVLMSDGAPTLADSNFTEPGQYDLGNGGSTSAAVSFVTQLTLAYARTQIEEKYGTEPLVYTLGLAVGNDSNATSVLDPANSSTAINNFWRQYNAAGAGDEITVQSGGWFSQDIEVTKIATELDKNYVDRYFEADGNDLAGALKEAFKDIVDSIQIQSGYFPTLISQNEDLSGYVSFVDRIGHGMSVTDVKGILIGDQLFSGADLSSNFVPSGGLLGTPTNPTALGREMVAAVQTRLGIESIDVAEALIALAYQNGQLYYNGPNDFSNYIGWYANDEGKFLGFYNEGTTVLPEPTGDPDTDPAFTIKSYGYLGQVDEAHGVAKSDMMYATVQIRKNIANGDEIMTFAVPAALIPTLTYNVELDESGNLTDLTVSGAEKPIRLVYEIALDKHLNLFNLREQLGSEYLSEPHHVGDDGSVYFFTNKWDHDNLTGYGTNNTYAYFNPSRQNDKYYYLEDTPIYADQNGTLYTGASRPSGTVYRRFSVYVKNGASLTTRTVYQTIPAEVLETAKSGDNNTWYVPKGDVQTNLSGYTLYKGGLDVLDASQNLTQTLTQARVPFVDTHDHQVDEEGYDFYVGATLGNNGKLIVKPETGLKLTKEMADPDSDVEQAFLFLLENHSEPDNNTYPALMVDAAGNETETEVRFTNGAASVALRPGYALYIGGMTAGHVISAEEQNTLYYIPRYEGVSDLGDVTITEGNMAHIRVTNEVRGTGNLTITKEIVHPLGSSYQIPSDKVFTFRVALTGDDVANAEFQAVHTKGTIDKVTTVNGIFTVTLGDNESLEILDLPEGTGVVVEELYPAAGFAPTYMDNGVAGDGRVRIEKNYTNTVVVVNTYTPAPVHPIPISVSGTKTLTGRDWDANDSFEFRLEKLVGPDAWDKLGESVYAASANKSFTFDHIFDGASYTSAGVNYYRIVEVEPQNTLGVSYDKTVHSFYVVVGDADMDGKLEITEVKSDRPDTTIVTGNAESGWSITANFTNTYSATGTATVTVDVNKTIKNNGGAEKSPAGYEFGIYDANGQLVGSTLKTTERGFARFALHYTAADVGQVYTYTLKEVHPATIPAGWTYSAKEVSLTVKVLDNGDGTISAIIYEGTEQPAQPTTSVSAGFENIYAPQKATIDVDFVKKTVNGERPGDRRFSFRLEGNGTTLTGTNDENGNVTFNAPLEFHAVGTYRFTITETSQDGAGITTDKTPYTMLVTVTDDGNGKLAATYVLENAPGQELVINNVYTAQPAHYSISGSKQLTGRPLLNDEFTFVLKEVSRDGNNFLDPATYEVKNFLDGSFRFPEFTYREEGVYVYEVTEKQAEGESFGITYDESIYTVTVTVADNGQGSLVADVDYEKNGEAANSLVFNNKYTPKPTYVEFTGDKELTGKINNTLEGDEFQFELYNSSASWTLGSLRETVPNQAGGTFKFKKIDFTTDEDQYFIVKEKNAGQTIDGITYDTTEFRVHVEVTDDLKGQLHTTVNIYDGNGVPQDSIQFTNIYQVTGTDTIELSGEKTLIGRDWLDTDVFTFNLYNADSSFAYTAGDLWEHDTVNAATAGHRFCMVMTYGPEDVGNTYYYVLIESEENLPAGVSRDETVYHITVAVLDDDQGGIKTVTTVENATVDSLNFTNVYTPEPTDIVIEAEKNLTGRDLVDGEFTFLLYLADQSHTIVPGSDPLKVKNDADGNVVFSFPVTEAGTYYFVACEDTSVSARLVTFDRTVYWVTLEVKDENGQLVAGDPVITKADSTQTVNGIVFNNAYDPNIPQTGDDTNLTLWMTLMVLSMAAAAALLIFESKRKQTI